MYDLHQFPPRPSRCHVLGISESVLNTVNLGTLFSDSGKKEDTPGSPCPFNSFEKVSAEDYSVPLLAPFFC